MTSLYTGPREGWMARLVHVLEWRYLGRVLPVLVLGVSLGITHLLWKREYQDAYEHLKDEFDSVVRETQRHVDDRMKVYEQMLRGLKALFDATGNGGISRQQFRAYVTRLRLSENYPGVEAVGYAPIVTAGQWHKHVEAMRKEGFSSYTIKSEGGNEFYAPTVYIEPFSGGNQHAIGFDVHSDMAYRNAMEQARDANRIVNTGKVLLRESDGHLRSGFLTFAPVYKLGAPHETLAERRANLIGWVYTVSHMETLMSGIIGEASDMIDIEILDGKTLSDETLMYDSDPHASHLISGTGYMFKSANPMEVTSHTWTLAAHSLHTFDMKLESGKAEAIAYGGVVISLMMSLFTWFLVYARSRALQDAREISQSSSRYKQMFEDNASIAYLQDPETGRIVDANAAAISFWGYTLEELRGMNISQISFVPSGKIIEVMGRIKEGASHCVELHHRLKSGEVRDVEVFSGPLSYQGKIMRYSIAHDITARKRAEEGLRLALTVFNSIREAVMVTDPENRIIMINPAFTEITGYSAKEVSDENSHFLFSGMHPDTFYLKIWETLQSRGEWSGEICNRHKNGELYHIWLSIRLVRDEVGKVTHHVAVFHKISKRRPVESSS